ncbi:MAG: hypothetical protein OXC94_03000 [Chloroflexi bacterium]|nr:hypothetical protein [Chloroflexota bacterium]
MLDGGFDVDVDHIARTIAEAEVVCLYFPLLRTTLLIDARTSEGVTPLVRLVPIAASAGERLRSLRRLRSQLPRPDSITTILWTRRVGALRRLGVWECLLERLAATGDGSAPGRAEACLDELGVLERRELRRALTGEQHRTLWGRPGVGDAAESGPDDGAIP